MILLFWSFYHNHIIFSNSFHVFKWKSSQKCVLNVSEMEIKSKKIKRDSWLKICDSAEWSSSSTGSTPVAKLAVLSRSHEVLATTVVGVLIEGPVALHYIAGVDVPAAEMILYWLTVITEFHHLTLEIGTLIDADTVGTFAGLYSEFKYKVTALMQGHPFTTVFHLCLFCALTVMSLY